MGKLLLLPVLVAVVGQLHALQHHLDISRAHLSARYPPLRCGTVPLHRGGGPPRHHDHLLVRGVHCVGRLFGSWQLRRERVLQRISGGAGCYGVWLFHLDHVYGATCLCVAWGLGARDQGAGECGYGGDADEFPARGAGTARGLRRQKKEDALG